jgi:hypothetical protein
MNLPGQFPQAAIEPPLHLRRQARKCIRLGQPHDRSVSTSAARVAPIACEKVPTSGVLDFIMQVQGGG